MNCPLAATPVTLSLLFLEHAYLEGFWSREVWVVRSKVPVLPVVLCPGEVVTLLVAFFPGSGDDPAPILDRTSSLSFSLTIGGQ